MSISADKLRKGLTSSPKYIPVSYRYDKQGSIYNDQCLSGNVKYYFSNSEINVIQENVKDMVGSVKTPCVLYDLGSGSPIKTRYFINTVLEKQRSLTYFPIDISEEFLYEQSNRLREEYGDVLTVKPVANDYLYGIDNMKYSEEAKLVLWLGGGCQNEVYERQIHLLSLLKNKFTNNDRLLLTLDVTQNKDEIENAYKLSPSLYLNAIWRLNRDFGSNIDTDGFQLCVRYIENKDVESTTGLNITVDFKENEPLYLHEGPGASCKYTAPQIMCMLKQSGLVLENMWIDARSHIAVCLIRK